MGKWRAESRSRSPAVAVPKGKPFGRWSPSSSDASRDGSETEESEGPTKILDYTLFFNE